MVTWSRATSDSGHLGSQVSSIFLHVVPDLSEEEPQLLCVSPVLQAHSWGPWHLLPWGKEPTGEGAALLEQLLAGSLVPEWVQVKLLPLWLWLLALQCHLSLVPVQLKVWLAGQGVP